MESTIKKIRDSEDNKWWQLILKNFGNSIQLVGEAKTMIAQSYTDHGQPK
ncbi:MAG: hypothetical protein LBF32_00755 [Streptococcaceae bacterium]|jgi:hypothetical protein|nr:hypothetical protein [Streptococcaceae bacterium]